jgi:hypothetical protein
MFATYFVRLVLFSTRDNHMKIRSISFDVKFTGQGIVNRNGSGSIFELGLKDVLLAKKIGGKPFVSRDCILHEVLAEPNGFKMLSQSSNQFDRLEVNLSRWRMLRGNLDATENATIRRKSPLMMTDAYPTEACDSIYIDTRAKGNMGGVFHVETVHKTELQSKVAVDLAELQFVSTDSQLGFPALPNNLFGANPDPRVVDIWNRYYSNTPFPTASYFMKGDASHGNSAAYQTEGVKFSVADTVDMVKLLVKKIKDFRIQKKDSWLQFHSIVNAVASTPDGPRHYPDVESLLADMSDVSFDVHSIYTPTTKLFDYSKIRDEIERRKKESKESKELAKAEKKAKKSAPSDVELGGAQ